MTESRLFSWPPQDRSWHVEAGEDRRQHRADDGSAVESHDREVGVVFSDVAEHPVGDSRPVTIGETQAPVTKK